MVLQIFRWSGERKGCACMDLFCGQSLFLSQLLYLWPPFVGWISVVLWRVIWLYNLSHRSNLPVYVELNIATKWKGMKMIMAWVTHKLNYKTIYDTKHSHLSFCAYGTNWYGNDVECENIRGNKRKGTTSNRSPPRQERRSGDGNLDPRIGKSAIFWCEFLGWISGQSWQHNVYMNSVDRAMFPSFSHIIDITQV